MPLRATPQSRWRSLNGTSIDGSTGITVRCDGRKRAENSVLLSTETQQCEDAQPAASSVGLQGLRPLVVPAAYGVYYCALGAAIVVTGGVILIADAIDKIRQNVVFSKGRATTTSPHTHAEEDEARDFSPSSFGDDCDPPRGNGNLRRQINVLRASAAWRKTDLNPADKVGYPGHLRRIKLLEEDQRRLENRYRNICGGEP